MEAQEFSASLAKFKKLGAEIIGISGGNNASKSKFCQKYDLTVTLLSDPDFATAKAYDAYGKKSFMGNTFNGIFRKTFVLDKKKKILAVFDEVKAKGHAEEVLKLLQDHKK